MRFRKDWRPISHQAGAVSANLSMDFPLFELFDIARRRRACPFWSYFQVCLSRLFFKQTLLLPSFRRRSARRAVGRYGPPTDGAVRKNFRATCRQRRAANNNNSDSDVHGGRGRGGGGILNRAAHSFCCAKTNSFHLILPSFGSWQWRSAAATHGRVGCQSHRPPSDTSIDASVRRLDARVVDLVNCRSPL